MEYIQEITLDLNTRVAPIIVGAKQYDNNSRIIKVNYTSDGNPYIITGNKVRLRIHKPDGTSGIYDTEISSDRKTVIVTLSEQCLSAAGRVYADLTEFGSNNKTLSTNSFIIDVAPAPNINNAYSSDEFQSMMNFIAQGDEVINEAKYWADQAETAKEAAKTASSHYPKIVDGYWWVWDTVTEDYVSTEEKAQGDIGAIGPQGPQGNPPSQEQIAAAAGDWLEENITQETGYVIDTSLSVSGAAADAKVTGDRIRELEATKAPVIYNTASGDIASFDDGADDMPIKTLVVGIDPVQAGTGDPSPENKRPISGWTWAEVTRTGKNLCPNSGWTQGQINANGLQNTLVRTAISSGFIFLRAGAYTLSRHFNYAGHVGDGQMAYHTYDLSKNHLSDSGWLQNNYSFTLDDNCYIRLTTRFSVTDEINVEIVDNGLTTQLELGSTATDYEPYHGATIPISWATEAGTVYAGTLDVTSGELTVTWAGVTFDGTQPIAVTNWAAREGSSAWLYPNTYNSLHFDNDTEDLLCDTLKPETYSNVFYGAAGISLMSNTNYGFAVRVSVTGLTTAAAINAYLAENPIQVVYRLTEPVTHQITPAAINTLLGSNNIWADCGAIEELVYPADTTLYVGQYDSTIQTQGGEIEQLQVDVDTIEGKIPNQASPQNQLADKAFVNSSINSAAAYFRGAFATRAALFAVAWQTADPEAANYVSNNDYAYVGDDEIHNDEAWRYIYVLQPGGTNNGWQPQFKVNESPLTAAQLAALNSGATAALIEQISINAAAIALKQAIINVGGILKGNGNGQVSAAVAGTDYATPAQIDAKYTKPAGGIPASDLASGVVPSAYTSNPAALGAAAPGSAGSWARGDHVHPKPSAEDIGAASRAVYQDDRIVIGNSGTVGDSAVNSIVLLREDSAEAKNVEILAPNSLMIGAYKAGSRPAQIQIGARGTPSANALGRSPWIADYTDSDGVFRSETDGLNVIAIGSAKAITRSNSPAIAFGNMIVARGGSSIAIGQQSLASGSFSVAVGVGLLSTQQDQVVLGRWNKDEQGDAFQIGNGAASGTTATRSNAFRVTKTGHVIAQNAIGIEDGQGGVVEITAAQLQALINLIS